MLLFLHWVGIAMWLGAQLTFMVWGAQARKADLAAWAHTWATLAKVQGYIVAPGAALATITGIVMMLQLTSRNAELGNVTGLWAMAGIGLLAGVVAIAVVTPLANRVAMYAHASLAAGEKDPRAERTRVLLAWAGTVTGLLVLVALYFGSETPRLLS